MHTAQRWEIIVISLQGFRKTCSMLRKTSFRRGNFLLKIRVTMRETVEARQAKLVTGTVSALF